MVIFHLLSHCLTSCLPLNTPYKLLVNVEMNIKKYVQMKVSQSLLFYEWRITIVYQILHSVILQIHLKDLFQPPSYQTIESNQTLQSQIFSKDKKILGIIVVS